MSMNAKFGKLLCVLFIAIFGLSMIKMAHAEAVVATISVEDGAGPNGLAYDSGKGEIFVADNNINRVSVISDSTNKVTKIIPVEKEPYGVAYDSGKGEIFVTNSGYDTVSVISDTTNTVIAAVIVGSAPTGVTYDSGVGEVFVANTGSPYGFSNIG
jgi:YVTN family beta-propeller protein